MDSLQKWNGLFFNVKQVSSFLSKYMPHYGKHKKYAELKIALLFVLFLSKDQIKLYLIGFPTLHDLKSNKRVTLAKILDQAIALDEDFDIVIAPAEKAQQINHRLQIVRFTGYVEGSTRSLFNSLKKKKFNIPKNETLILLVRLEKDLQLNYLELGQILRQSDVPYGQIFILGERKLANSYVFFCCQVFPEVKTLKDLDFSFLRSSKHNKVLEFPNQTEAVGRNRRGFDII